MSGELARSDDDIMREAAGRPAAFGEIFERHHGRIYGYLRKLVGTSGGAHDLTQETFLLAFKSRESYRPKGRLQGWLYRIATNLARTRFQRKVGESGLPEGAFSSTEADPADALVAADTRRAVEAALARLSLDEREVVLLRHFQGMRFRDVAQTLGITESTAKSRMRYALDKLAGFLAPLKKEFQA